MIDVRYAGDALRRLFDTPLAPFTEPAQPDPALTISCWDRSSVDVVPPSPPWSLDDLLPRGRVRGFDSGDVRATYDAHFGILNLYDARSRQAVYFAHDAKRIPPWIERAPFRAVLGWWATDRGLAVVHASAVGSSDGCVLITGPSGSGKSTTALACVAGGFEIVGDDVAVVALEPEPAAYATTSVAKLEATSPIAVDRLDAAVLKTVGDQMMLDLRDRLRPSAPVRAVIGVAIGSGSRTSAVPMTPGACFRALAGHSVVEALAGDRRPLVELRELARRVPAYGVTLGRDLDGVVATVRAILEGST
jgi:hypothetical protein